MKLTNSIFSNPDFNQKHSAWMEHIPFAFFVTDMLMPKLFVELGTHNGNSYFAFCQGFVKAKSNTRAFAIDHWQGDEQAGMYDDRVFEYVNNINEQHFSAFSLLLRMSFDEAVSRFEDGSIDLLHIDGLHSYEAVKHDFETWLPKMSERGVILFHDTQERTEGFGVWKLMDEIKNQYPFFEFLHGHGLGVVCTGSMVDKNFLRFIEDANSNSFIPQLFDSLGKKIFLDEQNKGLARERENLNQTVEKLENKLKQSQQNIPNQKAENTKLIGDINKLELVVTQLRQELSQLSTSWSWRITKPLRTLNFHTLKRLRMIPQVRRIKKSDLFDETFYLQNNPDVGKSGLSPARHYLLYGGFEGRKPSENFDGEFYLNQNPDVSQSGTNPLLHYILYGQSSGYATKPFKMNEEECLAKADITDLALGMIAAPNFKIALVLHLYYIDLADEFISYLKNIPVPFDLFISTPNDKEGIQKLFAEKLPNAQTIVKTFENKGRDIYPFISFLKDELMQYDLVCKIHTKNSNHNLNLVGWRGYLLNNLLGSPSVVNRIIEEFADNKTVGSIWPLTFPYLTYLNLDKGWGSENGNTNNFGKAKTYFPKLALNDPLQAIEFPAGSMLWFRPEALILLKEKKITADDFEEETGQLDGTLAHAIERLFGKIVNHAGFKNKTVFFPEKKVRQTIKQHQAIGDPKKILFIAHDLSRAGAEVLLLSLLRWINRHTNVKIFVLAIKKGIDGGALHLAYKEVAEVFLWDELSSGQNLEKAMSTLKEDIGGIDLIYGNTIISPNLYPILSIFKVPYITHIHELEESIQRYTTTEVRENWKQHTKIHIACSQPVEDNIILNHGISKHDIQRVNAFIQPVISELPQKISQRDKLNLPQNKTIIWSCGTIYWRKGPDIFIETAKILKERGIENFVFYWVGANWWDLEKEEWGEWSTWEAYIEKHELNDIISFRGESENPRELFAAGDIFYLSSREDPFPLVCLEAAECGLPVVCFKDGGGMPGFVEEDAGFVVPFLDAEKAADAIGHLITNQTERSKKGQRAREKLLQRHTIDIAAPEILKICHSAMDSKPLVSVIVPVYNQAKFLKARIDSILNQSFRDFEIIILDDASTDDSFEIAKSYDWHPAITILKNEHNSGSPFAQWQKGIELATGKYIWIAEGDDYCSHEFLQKTLPLLNDDGIGLAYCDSEIVNEESAIFGSYKGYYEKLEFNHWKNNYLSKDKHEINFGLGVKNTIPNFSAVIFRKECVVEEIWFKLRDFKLSADWYLYLNILKGKKIAFLSEKLNYHRKHSQTITSEYNAKEGAKKALLREAEVIHKYVAENYPLNSAYLSKWKFYIHEQILSLFPGTPEHLFSRYYDYQDVKNRIIQNIQTNAEVKSRFLFITCNDGSYNGGSEQLWIKTVLEMSKRKNEIKVLIKKWEPEPDFFKELRNNGIEILYKESIDVNEIIDFKPNLAVISIGDQDEGIGWYEKLSEINIPYVIINHLTKEPNVWPIDNSKTTALKKGYLSAQNVFFTGKNNHSVMEKRLKVKIPNYSIFFNPTDVPRDIKLEFPSFKKSYNIAMVGSLLRIHKGTHLAIEVFNMEKWKERPVHLNIYGKGKDEKILQNMFKNPKIIFHGHTEDIVQVWAENHAILMTSFMEGLPLVLVGAMLCRRVPIVTNIGAHAEIIKNNHDGFIAKNPTIHDIDEVMERVWKNVNRLEEIGINARNRILEYLPENPVNHFIDNLEIFKFQ